MNVEQYETEVLYDRSSLVAALDECIEAGVFSWDYETAATLKEVARHTNEETRLAGLLASATTKPQRTVYEKALASEEALYREAAFDPHRSRICTISFCAKKDKGYVLFVHEAGSSNIDMDLPETDDFDTIMAAVMALINEKIFSNRDIMKIAFNLAFETKHTMSYGYRILGNVADPHVAAVRYLQITDPAAIADPKRPATGKGLKQLALDVLGVEMMHFEDVLEAHGVEWFDEIDPEELDAQRYSAEDAIYSLYLYEYYKELNEAVRIEPTIYGLQRPYKNYWEWLCGVEMSFSRVIGEMEFHGFGFDLERARELEIEAKAALQVAQSKITSGLEDIGNKLGIAGLSGLNPGKTGKTNAIKTALFDILKVPPAAVSETTGAPSLAKNAMKDMIFMLEHNLYTTKEERYLLSEIPDSWRKHGVRSNSQARSLEIADRVDRPCKAELLQVLETIKDIGVISTLLSSQIIGRVKHLNPVTGRIHSHYSPWTETGRLNSSKPNGQNTPKPFKDQFGVRNLHRAAEGHVLLLIDFSGFELRIMGFVAQDEVITDVFNNDGDVHLRSAATFTRKKMEDVTKIERTHAKYGNFGICYGGTEHALRSTLMDGDIRMSLDECKRIVDAIRDTYPGIGEYHGLVAAEASKKGYIDTVYGYRRMLPHINSSNKFNRTQDERRAGNTRIQGSAADIMKKCQNDMYDLFADYAFDDVKMIAQIHDEVVLEVKNDKALILELAKKCIAIMQRPPLPGFPIKIVAEADISDDSVGRRWGDKYSFEKWLENS